MAEVLNVTEEGATAPFNATAGVAEPVSSNVAESPFTKEIGLPPAFQSGLAGSELVQTLLTPSPTHVSFVATTFSVRLEWLVSGRLSVALMVNVPATVTVALLV